MPDEHQLCALVDRLIISNIGVKKYNLIYPCDVEYIWGLLWHFPRICELEVHGVFSLVKGLKNRENVWHRMEHIASRIPSLFNLNLYHAECEGLAMHLMNRILQHSAETIVDLSSPTSGGLNLPTELPKVKRLFNVVSSGSRWMADMPELRYACLAKDRKTSGQVYRDAVQHILEHCRELKTMVFAYWDAFVARCVDFNLRQFHGHRRDIMICVAYSGRLQERKGPDGWLKQNEQWPWQKHELNEFQTEYAGTYWQVRWNANLWPHNIAHYAWYT